MASLQIQLLSTKEANSYKWQSLLIKVEDAECVNEDHDGHGRAGIDDGSGLLSVDDNLYDYTLHAGMTYTVTGLGYYSWDTHRISPRNEGDVVGDDATYHYVTYGVESFGIKDGDIVATVGEDTIPSGYNVEEGSKVLFTAMPDPGKQVKEWYLDSNAVGSTDETYTIESLEDTVDVKVEFEEKPMYALTLGVDPAESGTVSGGGEYEENAEVTIVAEAAEGYEFVNWTNADGDVVGESAEYAYTMPAGDVTLTANFEEVTTSLDAAFAENFEIYPNPTQGEFNLETDGIDGYVKIHNLAGKLIVEKQIDSDNMQIDITEEPAGIYLIKVHTEGNTLTRKLIKE